MTTYLVSGVLGIALALGTTTAFVHSAEHVDPPRAELYNYGTR